MIAVKECSHSGCVEAEKRLVLDANWRWIHTKDSKNCYTGNEWDELCSDPEKCAEECILEGVDTSQYANTYGVTPIPGGVKLSFVTGSNVGSRLFLMEDEEEYKLFDLKTLDLH